MAKELFGQLKKANDKYTIIASTATPDRDDEIILPSAFKNLKTFLATNPVILWAHDYSKAPIGKAVGGKITDNELMLNIEFAETDFGKEVKYLYDNGFMSMFPTGVGMNRSLDDVIKGLRNVPHRRGDEPLDICGDLNCLVCSPQASLG